MRVRCLGLVWSAWVAGKCNADCLVSVLLGWVLQIALRNGTATQWHCGVECATKQVGGQCLEIEER